ncbi:MAG: glutamyl-tRNA reductase [Myxococcales bacterium]|nr:glutamyl-tRNA reductase [Myxococcales bacterium]MCB9520075.1 glutamyl-tRNA reductase [Myxococcales bacterium]MCB9531801.1 glutamyl-tRNA reductase [Myxococcales bacterium]
MSRAVAMIGASHRSAPVEERERLAALDAAAVVAALDGGGVEEAALLSTCNRVELYLVGPDAETLPAARALIAAQAGVDRDWLDRFTYQAVGHDAVRHLLRVSSSLDSLVLGEPQILGQVKDAFAASQRAGGAGPILHRTFHQAFHAAKRVRTETRIAESAVSVSYAAVELAKKVFGSLTGKCVLVIGAGKMGTLALRHLTAAGATRVLVANRNRDRAIDAAVAFGGTGHGLDELDALLDEADIVISSTGSQHMIVRFEAVRAATVRRRYRPLFLIDIAVPRDIDPRCDSLPNVYLFDVDDLEKVVDENLKARRAEANRAEAIIHEECEQLQGWLAQGEVVPTIVSLRHKLNALKDAEVARLVRENPGLPPEAHEAAERMARALVNKILHEPTLSLRNSAQTGHHGAMVTAVRSLFDLNDTPGSAPGDGPVEATE